MSYSPWKYEITKPPALGRAATLAARILDAADLTAQPIEWRQSSDRPGGTPGAGGKTPQPPEAEDKTVTSQWQQRVEEAKAVGRREGEAAGRAQAAAELQPVIERSARAVGEMAAYKPALRKQAEADTVRLALAIAHRVLRREIAADPEALHGLVLAALEKLHSQEISRVKTHPAQAAQIAACLKNAAPNLRIEVVPEPSLQPGGLVFETGQGALDASVESQLHEIERGLTDRLQRTR